ALDGRMALRIERVHEWRANDRFCIRQAEQLKPGGIGVDDDAFLYVRDRVGRASHKGLELFAVLARRVDRRLQGARLLVGIELARYHGARTRRMLERRSRARTLRHGRSDDG